MGPSWGSGHTREARDCQERDSSNGYEGNAVNLMNEKLRNAKRAELVEAEQGTGGFRLRPARVRAQGFHDSLIWEGFSRHPELFASAEWWKHFRSN